MAISFVQTATGSGGGTTATTATFTSTSGNFLAVALGKGTSGAFSGVTDNKGNTFTQATSQDYSTTFNQSIWYCANITGGSGHTVTATTGASAQKAILVYEYSGVETVSPLDKTASAQGSGTAISSGATATTTLANELVFGGGRNSTDISAGAGFSNFASVTDAGGGINAAEGKVVASTGTYSADFTSSGTDNYAAGVATFKAAIITTTSTSSTSTSISTSSTSTSISTSTSTSTSLSTSSTSSSISTSTTTSTSTSTSTSISTSTSTSTSTTIMAHDIRPYGTIRRAH